MTMPHTGWLVGLAVAVAGIAGCDADDTEAVEVGDREVDANGFRLNGFRLNGFRLNGFRLNGQVLSDGDDAIRLDEIRLAKGSKKQTAITSAWLVGSELRAHTDDGKQLTGHQLKGVEFVFVVEEDGVSTRKTVRIDRVKHLPGSGLRVYDLEIRAEHGPWQPLCLDSQGEPTDAILLDGVWDPATGDRVAPGPGQAMTFACRDAALAKCVEWGYHPWASADGVPLADHHQACTRAARADYCGDGVPHTYDGVEIHVLDQLGIQTDEGDYKVEAEWGPDGARCLNAANTRLPDPENACELPACGAAFASGGLIQTGVPTP